MSRPSGKSLTRIVIALAALSLLAAGIALAQPAPQATTPSGDQTPWRVSEQIDSQTNIRECILGTGLKVGDDLVMIGFQALGATVNLASSTPQVEARPFLARYRHYPG